MLVLLIVAIYAASGDFNPAGRTFTERIGAVVGVGVGVLFLLGVGIIGNILLRILSRLVRRKNN